MTASKKKNGNESTQDSSANSMWGGRFSEGPAEVMERINASIGFDKKLYAQDIAGSKAHCRMLMKQKIISKQDGEQILKGLDTILREIEPGDFVFDAKLEVDPHRRSSGQAAHGTVAQRSGGDGFPPLGARCPG